MRYCQKQRLVIPEYQSTNMHSPTSTVYGSFVKFIYTYIYLYMLTSLKPLLGEKAKKLKSKKLRIDESEADATPKGD